MNIFGEVILFITGFCWSWGAETSKKITQYQGYHSSAWTFWGGYHRFNKWVFKLADNEVGVAKKLSQALLAALFFLPVSLLADSWYYWWFLVFGGIAYLVFREVKIWTKKKQS